MRLKTSGSDGGEGGSLCWGGGWRTYALRGGESCRAADATEAPVLAEVDEGTGLGPSPPPPPPAGWGERGTAAPPGWPFGASISPSGFEPFGASISPSGFTRWRPRGPRAGGGG